MEDKDIVVLNKCSVGLFGCLSPYPGSQVQLVSDRLLAWATIDASTLKAGSAWIHTAVLLHPLCSISGSHPLTHCLGAGSQEPSGVWKNCTWSRTMPNCGRPWCATMPRWRRSDPRSTPLSSSPTPASPELGESFSPLISNYTLPYARSAGHSLSPMQTDRWHPFCSNSELIVIHSQPELVTCTNYRHVFPWLFWNQD